MYNNRTTTHTILLPKHKRQLTPVANSFGTAQAAKEWSLDRPGLQPADTPAKRQAPTSSRCVRLRRSVNYYQRVLWDDR